MGVICFFIFLKLGSYCLYIMMYVIFCEYNIKQQNMHSLWRVMVSEKPNGHFKFHLKPMKRNARHLKKVKRKKKSVGF